MADSFKELTSQIRIFLFGTIKDASFSGYQEFTHLPGLFSSTNIHLEL